MICSEFWCCWSCFLFFAKCKHVFCSLLKFKCTASQNSEEKTHHPNFGPYNDLFKDYRFRVCSMVHGSFVALTMKFMRSVSECYIQDTPGQSETIGPCMIKKDCHCFWTQTPRMAGAVMGGGGLLQNEVIASFSHFRRFLTVSGRHADCAWMASFVLHTSLSGSCFGFTSECGLRWSM